MVGPINVKWKEMSQLDAMLTRVPLTLTLTFDLDLRPWIFKVKLYLGNGRPDCHGMKGTGVDSMPWCKTQPLCDPEAKDIVADGVTLDVSVSVDSSS